MVPTGSYDRGNADWVASNNGRVIEVLAINAGMAELDIDGSGLAANVATLTSMGITDAERAKLASLYTVGASMWRSTITHFTPWDLNFPSGLPQDFIFPPPYPPLVNYDASADEPDECSGCIIEAQTQVLGEQINVVGTPYSLNYRSNRTKGYIGGNKYYLRIAPSSIPPSLKEIAVSVKVGGTLTHRTFSPTPNLSTEFFCQMLLSMGNHL